MGNAGINATAGQLPPDARNPWINGLRSVFRFIAVGLVLIGVALWRASEKNDGVPNGNEQHNGVPKQEPPTQSDLNGDAGDKRPNTERESQLRLLSRWIISEHPDAVALLLSLGVAFLSVFIAVQALDAQTASNQLASDIQTHDFASKVSLWGETTVASGPAAGFPQILHIDNHNSQPLTGAWLIIDVNASVQYTSDGFAYTHQLSWGRLYALGHLAPCFSEVFPTTFT